MKFSRLDRNRIGGTDANMRLAYPAPRTPDGRVYRLSPNDSAHPRHFVLGNVLSEVNVTEALRQRMKQEPRAQQTVCPYSGTIASDDAFVHPEDVKAAVEMMTHDAVQDIQAAVENIVLSAFKGGSSSKGALTISASVNAAVLSQSRIFRDKISCGNSSAIIVVETTASSLSACFARIAALRTLDCISCARQNW